MQRPIRVSWLVGVTSASIACNALLDLEELPRQRGAAGGLGGVGGSGAAGESSNTGATENFGGSRAASGSTSVGGNAGAKPTHPGDEEPSSTGSAGAAGQGGESGDPHEDEPRACSSGTFDDDGDPNTACRAWSQCQPGYFVEKPGTPTTDQRCAACTEATFSVARDASECQAWRVCRPGEFVKAGGSAAGDRQCAACPAGSYSDTTNAEACTPCSPGEHSPSGSTQCYAWTTCKPGTYVKTPGSAAQDQQCAPCPDGTQSTRDNQTECLPPGACEAGTEQTAPATATTPAECTACAIGTFCAGGTSAKVACASGTWDHDENPATACLAWTTCAAGSYVTATGSATRDRSCTACPASSYSTAKNASSCAAWSTCAPGSRVTSAGSPTSDRTCGPCAIGTYSSSNNAANCTQCTNGFAATVGSTQCTPWKTCSWSEGGVATPGTASSDAVCGPASVYRQFGTTSSDYAMAVAVGSTGVCVAGYTSGTLVSGMRVGGTDAFVRKYDFNGTILWTQQFGSTLNDYVRDVAVDDEDNVYVAGYTEGPLDGSNLGMLDAYVRKYDSNGNVQWTRQFGTSQTEYALGVAVEASGNVYVAGLTQGALSGMNLGNADSYVRKYDAGGTHQWTAQFGTASSDRAYDVAVVGSGSGANVYVAGFAVSALPNCTPSACSNAGADDAYVRKYDSKGNVQWTRQFGSTASDYARAVAVDGSGDVWIVGETKGSLAGTNSGGDDVFLRRYTSAGGSPLTSQFGTSGNDSGSGLAPGGSSVYVAGVTEGQVAGPSAGDMDAYVRQYIPSVQSYGSGWQFGTASEDRAEAVAVEPNSGVVYVVGRTSGALVGTNVGGIDAFVRRIP